MLDQSTDAVSRVIAADAFIRKYLYDENGVLFPDAPDAVVYRDHVFYLRPDVTSPGALKQSLERLTPYLHQDGDLEIMPAHDPHGIKSPSLLQLLKADDEAEGQDTCHGNAACGCHD